MKRINPREIEKQGQIVHLHPTVTQMAERIEGDQPKRRRKHILRRLVLAITGGMVLLLSLGSFYQTRRQENALDEQIESAKSKQGALLEEQRALHQEYQLFTSPDYLAEVARRDYYYSKPGEIIFNIQDADSQE